MTAKNSPFTTGDYDNDKLIAKMWRSVTRQLDRDQRGDVVNHGMAGGFPGFCYYTETVKFYNKHETAIMAIFAEESEAQGFSNVFAWLAQCNMADSATDPITTKNFMVWVAVEILCQSEQYNSED